MTRAVAPPAGNTLHLYRGLLREAGYLPPPCQPYIGGRIRKLFRQHAKEADPQKHLKKARHDLRYIRAANAGDLSRMKYILLLCFGRLGRRRRELFARFIHKESSAKINTSEPKAWTETDETKINVTGRKIDTPTGETEIDASVPGIEKSTDETQKPTDDGVKSGVANTSNPDDWLAKWDLTKLVTFAKSHAQVKFSERVRDEVRPRYMSPESDIPPLNTWRQPWAPHTLRTKQKKFWKDMAERILPALPQAEWDMLRGLAYGSLSGPGWDIPKRRTPAKAIWGSVEDEHKSDWDWQAWAQTNASVIELKNSRDQWTANHTPDGEVPFREAAKIRKMTPRVMRRLYEFIWRSTPVALEPDENGKQQYQWARRTAMIATPTEAQKELFVGVTTAGKPIEEAEPGS